MATFGGAAAADVHRLDVEAGVVQRDEGAGDVLIGVGEQHLELGIGLEDVLHRRQRHVLGVLTFSSSDDLDVGVRIEHLLERLQPEVVERELQLADEDDHAAGIDVGTERDDVLGGRREPAPTPRRRR